MKKHGTRPGVVMFLLALMLPLLVGCGRDGNGEAAAAELLRYPSTSWQMYATPEEAGWSSSGLEDARVYAESIGSAAVMVIDDGAVVAAWGDVARRFRTHSIRKSLFNALIGIHQDEVGLERTLAELDVSDLQELTPAEKEATVYDLLTARSGVYHPAAYETKLWQEQRPRRGSHEPGTFWYYNNWDFNALLTVYEQETGTRIFDEFERRIGRPVEMQDYRARDGYYYWEADVSEHPAYPFRMSARDLARFGWFYLNDGAWSEQQLVPAKWVAASTQAQVETSRDADWGYLWWVLDEESNGYEGYMARGGDTQMAVVLPQQRVVFVHLADTYGGQTVPEKEAWQLLDKVMAAKDGVAKPDPVLMPLPDTAIDEADDLSREELAAYVHTYGYPDGRRVKVRLVDDTLVMDFGYGQFDLLPMSQDEFLVVDTRERVTFDDDADDRLRLKYDTLDGNPLQTTAAHGPAIALSAK